MVSSRRDSALRASYDDGCHARRYIRAAGWLGGFRDRSQLDQDLMPSDTEIRRRRLRFRAWHRGIREMDLLLGGFADAAIEKLEEEDLRSLEELLEVPDHDVFAWLTDQAQVPPVFDTPLFRHLKRFHDHAHPQNA